MAKRRSRKRARAPRVMYRMVVRRGTPAAAGLSHVRPQGIVSPHAPPPMPGGSSILPGPLPLAATIAGAVTGLPIAGALSSPLGFVTALPSLAPSIAAAAPIAIALGAIGIPIAALTMGKSEAQLLAEANAAGQRAIQTSLPGQYTNVGEVPLFKRFQKVVNY